ncbi:MAG: transglutaminase family protein, partial [Sphingomonadaceae bacterium]
DARLDYDFPEPADVLLAMAVIPGGDQFLVDDRLTIDGSGPLTPVAGEESLGERTWLRASGSFSASYHAVVDVDRYVPVLDRLKTTPRAEIPALVASYLFPSRYCESDRFEQFVEREFGELQGGAKAAAMAAWIGDHVDYVSGSSDGTTTAGDSFIQRQGVCRDFAHLLITFARAAGIPARMVSAYAWRLDPPDFHAVVELWLEGAWHLVDPSRLAPIEGLVRIAVGRDATDISFMTIFGAAEMKSQSVMIERIEG